MSKKSDPVSSASKAKTKPFTPMRRFFRLKILKPIRALGKQIRDHSHAAHKKLSRSINYPLLGSSSFVATTTAVRNAALIQQQQHRQGTVRIALQQYDQSFDAIVITTLSSHPFCCHEDLLTMSRSQLVQAAAMFNSRLPGCSQIELADGIADAYIRHSIERLVGIVPNTMPGVPETIKSRRFERMDISEIDLRGDLGRDILPSPPTSPLSKRVSRRQEKALPFMSSPPHILERLEEEDENDFLTTNKPNRLKKKRKVPICMASHPM